MCVVVGVSVHVCMCLHGCVYLHACVCVSLGGFVFLYIFVCFCVCVCVFVCAEVCRCFPHYSPTTRLCVCRVLILMNGDSGLNRSMIDTVSVCT